MLHQSSYTKVPWVSANNTLLVRDDVGHAKPSTYDLPPHQFVYGRALDRDPEGAKEGTRFPLVPSSNDLQSDHDLEIPWRDAGSHNEQRLQASEQNVS